MANFKILFLYDDIEHATPLLRAQPYLAENHQIDLCPTETHSPEAAIRLVTADADMLMLHQPLMSDDALDHGKPVVILERIDGAQLAASRKWLPRLASTGDLQPSAAAVIKGYTFREPGLHNSYRGRYHAHLLRNARVTAATPDASRAINGLPSPQLAQADLLKIHAGFGFGAYTKLDQPRAQMVDFSALRSVAVHCVCWVDYHSSEIETHRRAAVAAAQSWADAHPNELAAIGAGRIMRPAEYLQTMFMARVVVSPWGWGEACHRDYEAMLLGSVLVKPSMEHVVCWPDIYVPGRTYIPCRLDFADLPEIIDKVTANWDSWKKRREYARQVALDAGDPRRVAKRVAQIIEGLRSDYTDTSGDAEGAVPAVPSAPAEQIS